MVTSHLWQGAFHSRWLLWILVLVLLAHGQQWKAGLVAASVRDIDFHNQVVVPDAFDQREWICNREQPPMKCNGTLGSEPCGSCCDIRRGPRGDDRCWRYGGSFVECCDAVSLGRRGVAAYRTFIPKEVSLLHFRACSMHCTIYIERQRVSDHIGGYSPFWVDVSEAINLAQTSEVELLVIVDNRFSPTRPVHQPYFDFYQPGGILRAVEAHIISSQQIYVARAWVLPQILESSVRIHISVDALKTYNESGYKSLQASLSFDGAQPVLTRTVPIGAEEFSWDVDVPNPRLWFPDSPALHELTITIRDGDRDLDAIRVRFGIRLVRSTDGQIFLNERPLEIRGVNRHESRAAGGLSMSLDEMLKDIALLKALGANFVRGSHYSQDQRWLDLCDASGILVWEETLSWQPGLEDFADAAFMAQQMTALDETLNASMNHPSVIMWGFFNEGETDSASARDAHIQLASLAKSRDPSRLVAWASKNKMKDQTLDLADVIAFNDYPGWYDSDLKEIPNVWHSYADWIRQRYPGKPFIVAEAGASGLVGYRSPGRLAKWSEDLQAHILRASVIAARTAGFAGIVLWQFADNKVDTELFFEDNPRTSPMENVSDADWVENIAIAFEATNSPFGRGLPLRPRGLNNKGLLSLDRNHQKLSFFVVRDAFQGLCQVHSTLEQGRVAWPESVRLVTALESGGICAGCFLAVHTWNILDRLQDQPGLRVHVHQDKTRASFWRMDTGGYLRVTGHADGRETALGEFMSVASVRDATSWHIVAREGVGSLWLIEHATDGILLRVAFGSPCGGYLSVTSDERDDKSMYISVQLDRSKATIWRLLPALDEF